jgi:hypothetical protein
MKQSNTSIDFTNSDINFLGDYIRHSATLGLTHAKEGEFKDSPGAIICGLGSSIMDKKVQRGLRKKVEAGWKVMTMKEGLTFLPSINIPVDFSVAMDPGGVRQTAKTPIVAGVRYYVASSCNPIYFKHLLGNGADVRLFHSACGYSDTRIDRGVAFPLTDTQGSVILGDYELNTLEGWPFTPIVQGHIGEVDFYAKMFGGYCDVMCGGFTVGNRGVALLQHLGFKKIIVAGLDFGWREGQSFYGSAFKAKPHTDIMMEDEGMLVDGKPWFTRPDMLASAAELARKVRKEPGAITVLGDSLVNGLLKHDDSFIDSICMVGGKK